MADLTEAQIREILAGCEGVTPGPWEPLSGAEHAIAIRRNEDGILGAGIHAKLIGAVDIIDGETVICIDEDDRSHIARLDPHTVAALCNMALRSSGAEAKITEQAAEIERLTKIASVLGQWGFNNSTIGQLANLEDRAAHAGLSLEDIGHFTVSSRRAAIAEIGSGR